MKHESFKLQARTVELRSITRSCRLTRIFPNLPTNIQEELSGCFFKYMALGVKVQRWGSTTTAETSGHGMTTNTVTSAVADWNGI